jgi:DNA-binding NtrC family response regulator
MGLSPSRRPRGEAKEEGGYQNGGKRDMDSKLLFVTEKPSTEHALVDSMDRRGYEMDVATDRGEALELCTWNEYDAALVDETVQDRNGIEVFREIEALQQGMDGILCCYAPWADDADEAIQAGMRHVVAKPVDSGEIVPLIEGIVNESSRPFERRFPKAPPGFETEEGMTRGRNASWCEICSRSTHWLHKELLLYFCCEDCLARYRHLDGT